MFKKLQNKLPIKRLWQTLNINIRINPGKRTEWLKKHNVFYSVGNDVSLQMRKVPLYPRLISFGSNIVVASGVSFLTHDAIHQVINCGSERHINEKIGCIDIRDNCFIGANSIIYNNVRIGPNSVIAAGAVVTKDVPPGTVWGGGVPARMIGTYEDLIKKRLLQTKKENEVKQTSCQELSDILIESKWKQFDEERKFSK